MYQMIRLLCLVLGMCCVFNVAYATPQNNSDYRTQSISHLKTKQPTLIIVQHNLLNDLNQVHSVLYMFSKAYTDWTGNMIIPLDQLQQKLGKSYGATTLNACTINQAKCILQKITEKFGHTKFEKIILLGIGGLGKTVLISTYFLYPKKKRVRKGPQKIMKKNKVMHVCRMMIRTAFPNHGTFSLKGMPAATKIWVRGVTYSIQEDYVTSKNGKRVFAKRLRKIPIPANEAIKAWAFIPGRPPMKIKEFKIRPKQHYTMTIILPDIVVNVVPTNPRPKQKKRIKPKLQPPTPPQPLTIYKKWWFWTGIGVVTIGTTVGIVIATRPPQKLENDHITMLIPR